MGERGLWMATGALALLAAVPDAALGQRARSGEDGKAEAGVATPARDAQVDRLLQRFQAAAKGKGTDQALALVAYVGARFGAIPQEQRDSLYSELWPYLADYPAADRSRVIAAMRQAAMAVRGGGGVAAELFLLEWALYGAGSDDSLGLARALHRRAAETARLADGPAGSAREVLALRARELCDAGRQDEAVRALDDTFAELDAAGMHYASERLVRTYAEAMTLARRDTAADGEFAALVEWYRANADPRRRDRLIQLAQNQAAYYRNIVGRFAAAEAPGRYAAAEAERLMGREQIATQKARYNFALALLGQGKAVEALPYFEEALPLQLAAETDPWRGNKTDTVILLTTLARARAQVPGQEEAGLEAARDAADRLRALRAARLEGSYTADPGVAALAKAVAQGDRRDPLARAFDMVLLAAWAARETSPDALDQAFIAAQELTLTDAGEAINEAAARDIAGSGPLGLLVRARQDTAGAVVALNAAYRDASLGSDEARSAAMRAELDRLARQLADQDRRLAREFPEYASLTAPRALDVPAVQALLAPDEAVLVTLPSEGHVYALAVSNRVASWHRIDGGDTAVAALVARLKCRIDEATCAMADYNAVMDAEKRGAPSPIDERYPRYDRGAAYRLYQQLVRPVIAALPEGGRIYTVASGPIAGLPLAALVASPPPGDPESGSAADLAATDWLADHYRFVTLPSVSALGLAQKEARPVAAGRPPLVAYGAPTLAGNGAATARGGAGGRRRGGVGVRGAGELTSVMGDRTMASVEKLRRLDPLPGTVTELTRLSGAIAAGGGLRLGAAATEAAVKGDPQLPMATTVVFATHGLLPGEMGKGSEPGLVLTPPASASAMDDGLLTASEAATLSLSARWVVLSACNTATPAASGEGQASGGESLSSLSRSFLYAGAGNLLASHWRVADDATAALTVETLSDSADTPATALARAMRAVRSGRRADGTALSGWAPHWAHPASWAPFTLVTNRDR